MKSLLNLLPVLFVLLPTAAFSQADVIFNGGITVDERESAPAEGTRLEFFVSSGSYLSAIQVSIRDSEGREVLSTTTRGPWLILDLASGTYTVEAKRGNGDSQGGTIEVTAGNNRFAFMFPE